MYNSSNIKICSNLVLYTGIVKSNLFFGLYYNNELKTSEEKQENYLQTFFINKYD